MTEEQLNKGQKLKHTINVLTKRFEELVKFLSDLEGDEIYIAKWSEEINEVDIESAIAIKGRQEIVFIEELVKFRREELIALQKEFEKL